MRDLDFGLAEQYLEDMFNTLVNGLSVYKVTKYVSEKFTVKLTKIGKPKKSLLKEYKLTIGTPNYLERKFIKICKKAGEPFPIKNIQLKFYHKMK
jgi:hypothetical protein